MNDEIDELTSSLQEQDSKINKLSRENEEQNKLLAKGEERFQEIENQIREILENSKLNLIEVTVSIISRLLALSILIIFIAPRQHPAPRKFYISGPPHR